MKFNEYLNEIFDKPLSWKIIREDNEKFMAEFFVDNLEYQFIAEFNKARGWEIDFFSIQNDKYNASLNKKGNEFKVLATIVDICKVFIEIINPSKLEFVADIKEFSRIKLYDRFAKELVKLYNYNLVTNQGTSGKIYTFTKADK